MLFQVKAVSGKEMVLIDITANSEREALDQVKANGLIPITLKPKKPRFYQTNTKQLSVSLFTLELLALLDAGLNLVEAIETLASKEHQQQPVLTQLLNVMYEGQTLSVALERQSQTFPMLLIATIKSSEKLATCKRHYVDTLHISNNRPVKKESDQCIYLSIVVDDSRKSCDFIFVGICCAKV
jgi:general secretion pathway protein F